MYDHVGGPARQHRRKRREAARTATDVAEEARKVAKDNNTGDEINNKKRLLVKSFVNHADAILE